MTRARGTPGRVRDTATLVLVCLLMLGLASCQSKSNARPVVPDGFDIPKGVTITDGGAKRTIGKPATVVYQIEQRAASAVTVTMTAVVVGNIAQDFRFFNLPQEVKSSTPLYVHLRVKNEGPSGLGGVALPILMRTTKDQAFPPNELVGHFRPCPTSALPASFLAGSTTNVCLVFLLPKGLTPKSVDLQTGEAKNAIHYEVPSL